MFTAAIHGVVISWIAGLGAMSRHSFAMALTMPTPDSGTRRSTLATIGQQDGHYFR